MDFGQQLLDFCTELKEMKDARFGLSRLSAFSEGQRPDAALLAYQPKGAGEDFVEEKDTASAAIQTNIKIKSPQWGFVGMASPDGSAHVHPVCKRRGFCNRMLNNFSSEGSGGVFARETLMLQRDVIYFANSQEEVEFVGKYSKSLVSYSDRVRHWFAKYKSAKKSASTIQQPAILAKEHANTQDDHIPGDQKEKAPFVFEEVFATNALERLGLEGLILEPVEHADDALSPGQQQDVQVPRNTSGPLALTQMPMCPAPEFMQIDNTLVKASDLLPRKLLILDVEGLLVYAEGFMERTAKTAAGDAIRSKKVIRRNDVEEFITRCFDLFDLALWTCTDSNALREYMFYLFSGEQYDKLLFKWDHGKALDTNEKRTRNNQQIRLLLKPLKTVWERFPNFNARNTLLVDIHPFRASVNPEDTGIFPVPYTGSHSDTYLTTVLLPYLEGLSQAFDIREYVREHVLQGSQRPLHFRATSRGLLGLLHKYSLRAIETYVPTLLTKRGKLTDFEKSVLSRLPDIDELEDHDCVAWARLLGLSWNQALQDDLTTIGVSDENHTRTKASVKYARDFLVEVKNVHLA
ncbi:hypothetical protein R1sor_008309 [Riccia sorocarpa]|uniref:Mitochondrial import inner membrane translocase subunit TIM50 n=1 Tax=Riccia sorocarpa TaxID=122646 RepID=A0ABD3HTE8_9MARC